jgi:hypothetical protein
MAKSLWSTFAADRVDHLELQEVIVFRARNVLHILLPSVNVSMSATPSSRLCMFRLSKESIINQF